MKRSLAVIIAVVIAAGAVAALLLRGGGDDDPSALSVETTTSTVVQSTAAATTAVSTTGGTASSDCTVVDVRVTGNGPLDGIGVRFNPDFEVTASFLESGGDAIVHINAGYQDEANDQWVTYTWVEGANLPTPEEAAIPNGTYDPTSLTLTGTETLHHLIDFEAAADSPISAPFTANYAPADLVVAGSIDLSDGPHTFTLAAQRIDILEGPGCPVVTDTPSP